MSLFDNDVNRNLLNTDESLENGGSNVPSEASQGGKNGEQSSNVRNEEDDYEDDQD